jgi:hypothetical protein
MTNGASASFMSAVRARRVLMNVWSFPLSAKCDNTRGNPCPCDTSPSAITSHTLQ